MNSDDMLHTDLFPQLQARQSVLSAHLVSTRTQTLVPNPRLDPLKNLELSSVQSGANRALAGAAAWADVQLSGVRPRMPVAVIGHQCGATWSNTHNAHMLRSARCPLLLQAVPKSHQALAFETVAKHPRERTTSFSLQHMLCGCRMVYRDAKILTTPSGKMRETADARTEAVGPVRALRALRAGVKRETSRAGTRCRCRRCSPPLHSNYLGQMSVKDPMLYGREN